MSDGRAVVRHNVTWMRDGPSERAEQVSQAIFGETVALHEEQGDYTRIQTPDNYGGWILTRHLSILETGERYPVPSRAALVVPLFLPVFRLASGRSERIALLTLGTVVELAEGDPSSEFFAIRMPGGESGYVEASALIVPEYPPRESLGPNLAVVARGFVGVPYLWGGRTPFGIDCSGFVQRVYWLCGHVIPRDAYQQAQSPQFSTVDREETEAGDLLFFRGPEDRRARGITHVGMALGNDFMIHAHSHLGVALSPLVSRGPSDVEGFDYRLISAARLVAS